MKQFLFFAVAAVLFTAYSKDALDEEQGIQNIVDEAPATLTVGFEDDETRIQLNSAQKTVWTNGDLVSVFYLSDANQQWQYTGETGEDEGENMAGGAGGNLVFEDTVLTEVTLNCLDGTSPTEKGVEVANTATAFDIALSPQTFAKGLTVEITATNGATMTKSTDNSIVIERNHIKPMTAFAADLPVPETWKIYYTAIAKVEPYDKRVFGATYVSNVWDSETGNGVITFEGDVTTIGYRAFYDCSILTSVTIPDSVTTIGGGAFYSCSSLTSVTIPDSVTTIGERAFSGCKSLTSVTIPDSVTTIGGRAFEYCNSLTSVTIGDSVTTIGECAFRDCTSLKEFKGKFAADGGRCLIVDGVLNAFAIGCGVTQYTIPDSVMTIGRWAFEDCDSLTSVTIPDSVTTIGWGAFEDCNSLTSVTIGDSVTTIEYYAFNDCRSLTSVTIPDSVTTIGGLAFYKCGSLKAVYCKPTTPPEGSINMFDYNASGRRIYVPASDDDSIINAYKAKQYWRDYADYIFEEE